MIKVTDHEIYILDTKHVSVLSIVKHADPQGSPMPLLMMYVVVVLGLRALRDSIKCCICCLPERDLP